MYSVKKKFNYIKTERYHLLYWMHMRRTIKAAILIQSELLCYSKQCHTLSMLSDNQTVVTVFYGQIV